MKAEIKDLKNSTLKSLKILILSSLIILPHSLSFAGVDPDEVIRADEAEGEAALQGLRTAGADQDEEVQETGDESVVDENTISPVPERNELTEEAIRNEELRRRQEELEANGTVELTGQRTDQEEVERNTPSEDRDEEPTREPSSSQCQNARHYVEQFQKDLFNIQDGDDSLKELLKKRDDIHANMAVYEGLLGIWRDYNSFLGDNEGLKENHALATPSSAQEAVQGLHKLKNFLKTHQQPVERYKVISEVMSIIDKEELAAQSGAINKTEYIRNAVGQACQEERRQALMVCQNNAWHEIGLSPIINENPQNPGQLLNKFTNHLSVMDSQYNIFSNLGGLFVDNEKLDSEELIGNRSFANTLTELIDSSISHCRSMAVLGRDSGVQGCINGDLEDILEAQGKDLTGLNDIKNFFKGVASEGASPELNTIGDLTSSYLELSKRTSDIHGDIDGGTIDRLSDFHTELRNIKVDLSQANDELLQDDRIMATKRKFEDLTEARMLKLAGQLQNYEKTDELFRKALNDSDDPYTGTVPSSIANDIIGHHLCNGSLGMKLCQGGSESPFLTNSDEPKVNTQYFQNLLEKVSQEEIENHLKEMEEKLRGNSAKGIEGIDQKIARIKAGKKYQRLSRFKNYMWDQLKTTCSKEGEPNKEYLAEPCRVSENTRTGIVDVLELGGELIAYREDQERDLNLQALRQDCRELANEDYQKYLKDFSETGICNSVETTYNKVTRESAARIERRRRIKEDINNIYTFDENGDVVDVYKPKSTFSILLPQVAYTVNEQLPFYFVQRPAMNMAIENYRLAGFQQKTHQAYFNSLQQSFLNNSTCGMFGCFYNSTMLETASPTYGQAGFDFSTAATGFNL